MSRTTTAAVQSILGGNYGALPDGTPPDLQQYIETAGVTVDRVVTCATGRGWTLSAAEAELIERWLAAAAYCEMDPLYSSKSTGGASGQFTSPSQSIDGEANRYKRKAIELDPSGCLNALLNRRTARAAWLGKPPSAQTPYYLRD